MLGLMQQQTAADLVAAHARGAASRRAPRWCRRPAMAARTTRTWAETERRARRLVRVLQGLGVKPQDRVGTLAWNDHRHLEIYYATSGMQAICHTINPRLVAGRHRLHHQPCRRQRAVRRSRASRR